MAYINYISESQAPAGLAKLYKRYRDQKHGGIDHILKIHGPNPPSLEAHYVVYKTLMYGKSPLSRKQREMIALVASALNDCTY